MVVRNEFGVGLFCVVVNEQIIFLGSDVSRWCRGHGKWDVATLCVLVRRESQSQVAVCASAVCRWDGGAVGEDLTADGSDVVVGWVASDLGECGMGKV